MRRGCRAGEALGLRHEDIAAAEREISVVPRDNANGARYYSPGLLLTGLAVAGARSAGLTERDGHLTIMACENSEQRGGRRGHRR